MDPLMAARFPFLNDASELAQEQGVDIEMLITSDTFAEARARGVERLENALDKSEVSYVPLTSSYDQLMEVMSYPYARMIVSVLNDRFMTKRYALSEAVRMNRLLGEEKQMTVLSIAKSLGVNGTLDNDRLRMHFADYLRFSTRMKSQEWKLVNSDLHGGYVELTHEKFDRLLQNALQDKIESELPLKVPEEYASMMSKDIQKIRNILENTKSRFETKFSGTLVDEQLPPCIRTLLNNALHAVNLPHSGRFALVSFLHTIGMNSEQILALFSQSPDFDESKSMYQIKHITGELNNTDGYTPPECHTMKSNGLCVEEDDLCAKINHPLIYYRIKSGTGRPQN